MAPRTEIYFGLVPEEVGRRLMGYPLHDEGLANEWGMFDRSKVGLMRSSTMYLDFSIQAQLQNQLIMRGLIPDSEFGHPIGDWRGFTTILRKKRVAYDFLRAENHGDDYWSHEVTAPMVLERWRPGLRQAHIVRVDAHGNPVLTAAQLSRLGKKNVSKHIPELLGTKLGSLVAKTVIRIENASEVSVALGRHASRAA